MPKARQFSVRLERFRPFVRVISDNLGATATASNSGVSVLLANALSA